MIKASYGEMKNNASEITKAANDYKTYVEKVYAEVDALSDVWKGADNQEYVATVNNYKEAMMSLGAAVEGYAKFLNTAENVLNTTQDEVKNLARKL